MGRLTHPGRPGEPGPESSWIKSSLSFSNSNCVEVAGLPDGRVGLRHSKDSEGPVGGVEVKPTKRETQTTDALKVLMQGKLASAKTAPRARPAS